MTTTATGHKQGFWMKRTKNRSARSWRTPEQGNPERCCFTGGGDGVHKGIGYIFGDSVLPCTPENMPTKTCRNNTGKRYKKKGFRRPLTTRSSCGTVFYENSFQLSRLGCEISMSVFEATTTNGDKSILKPGNTTNIAISRGFEDKSG